MRRVLSGMMGEPRAGVMRVRRVRKEEMSKAWSEVMLIVGGALVQSAVVMALAIVTIDVHIERTISSLRAALVRTGKIAFKISSDDEVACRQGDTLLVMIGNEYLRTIGLARAVSAEVSAPLEYMS